MSECECCVAETRADHQHAQRADDGVSELPRHRSLHQLQLLFYFYDLFVKDERSSSLYYVAALAFKCISANAVHTSSRSNSGLAAVD